MRYMNIPGNKNTFYPFYERIADRIPVPVIGRLLVSLSATLLFVLPHLIIVINQERIDTSAVIMRWDWMIGLIIFIALNFLYYATHSFRNILPLLETRWTAYQDNNYLIRIRKTLSDRAFLIAATFFGLLNLLLGAVFGAPEGIHGASLYWGYFLVGFICGLPAWGIYGVIDFITYLTRAGKFELEYTSPDGCGGVRFLGDAIFKFSTVTLIVGVCISLYILNAEWENDSLTSQLLMWLWVIFPYVLSLLVLFVPSAGISHLLHDYKIRQDDELKQSLRQLQMKISNSEQCEGGGISDLREQHAHLMGLREMLYKMRTWPFGSVEHYKYSAAIASNALITITSLPKTLKESIKELVSTVW